MKAFVVSVTGLLTPVSWNLRVLRVLRVLRGPVLSETRSRQRYSTKCSDDCSFSLQMNSISDSAGASRQLTRMVHGVV